MYIDPTLYSGRPADRRTSPEEAIYDHLDLLSIPFFRVDHDHADTMEDCLAIEKVLQGKICKNLFLCNRQGTDFYLLLMPGGKPFKTKHLSAQLGCSRLSFASAEAMGDLLRTTPGSVSALELLFDTARRIRLVVDEDLLLDDTVCCHPGLSVSTVRMARDDLLRYAASTGHDPTYVVLPREAE